MARFPSTLRKFQTLVLTAALSILSLGAPAHAQGLPGSSPLSSSATQGVFKAMSQQLTKPGAAPISKPQPLAVSAFKPAKGRVLPARMAAALPGLDAAQKKEIESLYVQLLDSYDSLLDENGETRLKNNVAGAVMYALMVSHYVLSGEELSEKQQDGLLDSVNRALSTIPAFKTMTDARKQELYEALILNANMALALQEEGAEDPDSAADAQELAANLFAQVLGRDHSKVQFTATGLRLN